MTLLRKDRLFLTFKGNPPVVAAEIQLFEENVHREFPEGYAEFLQYANGGEGFIGPNAYVIFWRLQELIEMNDAYQVSDYAPGLFLFGSDGGGEAFAFDTRSVPSSVVSVPFVGMDLELVRTLAADFAKFIDELYAS